MSNFDRRLKRAESKLNMDREQTVVVIRDFHTQDRGHFDLSNPVEEWLTYPEALASAAEQNGLVVLHEASEIEARRAGARI